MFKDLTIWTVLSGIVGVLGFIWIYFGALLNIKERLVALETKMELFWKPLQDFLTTAIHHPITPSMDEKLERFDTLTIDELYELKAEIKQQGEKLEDPKDVKALYLILLISRINGKLHDKLKEECRPKGGMLISKMMFWK